MVITIQISNVKECWIQPCGGELLLNCFTYSILCGTFTLKRLLKEVITYTNICTPRIYQVKTIHNVTMQSDKIGALAPLSKQERLIQKARKFYDTVISTLLSLMHAIVKSVRYKSATNYRGVCICSRDFSSAPLLSCTDCPLAADRWFHS